MHMFGLAVFVACVSACGGGGGGAPDVVSGPKAIVGAAIAQTPAIAATIAPAVSTTPLTLHASAAGFGDEAAVIQVRHNDTVLAVFEIRGAEPLKHRTDVPFQVTDGVLELVWLQAQGRPGRSVTVESIAIGDTSMSPLDNEVLFDHGDGPAAFDGVDVVPGQRTLTAAGALRFMLPAAGRSTTAAAKSGLDASASDPGFYVDANVGNDSNSGTIDRPWRSLARVAAVRLSPGQGIYLRCGGTWRESLSLSAKQLVDGSTIAGYGSECSTRKAVISGADDFSGGWQKSGSVWSRSLPAGTAKITQLFVAEQALRTAQWPNADSAAGSRRMALVAAAAASTKTAALQSGDSTWLLGKDMAGATVQVRTQPWFVETRRVLSVNDGHMNLDSSTDWALETGDGFVLQDKHWMLDAPGEFFHDTAAQRLYLIAPFAGVPTDLNTATVEGSVRDIALALTQRSKLVVRNLALRAARVDGLRITDAPQARLERIEARDNMSAGVRLWQWEVIPAGTPGSSITDSLASGNGQYGIDAQYVARAQIKRNRVLATGTAAHHVDGVFASIAAGPGAVTEANVVDGSGYIGIRFSSVAGSVIARNTVSGYCSRLSDCGAIYTWTGRNAPQAATESSVEDNRIFGAIALDVVATTDGSDVIAGVYVDDYSHGVTVRGNTIFGAPMGVFIHNASRTTVTNNRIWLPARVGLWVNMDERDVDTMVSNRFADNQIVPLVNSKAIAGALPEFRVAQAFWFWHWRSGAAAMAPERNHFTNNAVVQLQGAVAAHAWLRGPGDERYVDSVGWQRMNLAEPLVQRPLTFDALQFTTGPELVQNGGFDAGLASWRTWHHDSSTQFNAKAETLRPGCDGPCAGFISGHGTDLLASAPFQMRPGLPHVYRWKAVMPPNSHASMAYPYISRETSPWDAMWNAQGFVGYNPRHGQAGEVLSYEIFFTPKSADAGRVNLQLDTPGVSVGVDSISVREVTGYAVARLTDWAAVVHAYADAPRIWKCADLGWPSGCQVASENGQRVDLPLHLPAGAIQMLVRTDSRFVSRR